MNPIFTEERGWNWGKSVKLMIPKIWNETATEGKRKKGQSSVKQRKICHSVNRIIVQH